MKFRNCLGLIAATAAILFASSGPAQAVWGNVYCDIFQNGENVLEAAVDYYNAESGEDRMCGLAIRFMTPQHIARSEALIIDQKPFAGQNYGTAIRKCMSSGSYVEPDCDVAADEEIVLDFSSYKSFGGYCPIRVAKGAKVDFINLTIIAPKPEAVFCTLDGDALPLENKSNAYAWIHNVTIQGPQLPMNLQKVDSFNAVPKPEADKVFP